MAWSAAFIRFVDTRASLMRGQVTPFLFADAGYTLGKIDGRSRWDAGGFTVSAGTGFVVHTSTAVSFVMEIAYYYQRSKVVESIDYWYYHAMNVYGVNNEFVMITLGIGF